MRGSLPVAKKISCIAASRSASGTDGSPLFVTSSLSRGGNFFAAAAASTMPRTSFG